MVGFKRGLLTITTKASTSSLKESLNAEFFFFARVVAMVFSLDQSERERERERRASLGIIREVLRCNVCVCVCVCVCVLCICV
jgi:hypothetical protein